LKARSSADMLLTSTAALKGVETVMAMRVKSV
jgi:hypothetical protein